MNLLKGLKIFKLFIPALLCLALLAPGAQAQPASVSAAAKTQISRDAGFELTATKKKVAKKPAARKMSAPKKKAAKISNPVA